MDRRHEAVILRDRFGDEVEIDVGIAPLIKELWRAGIDTWESCEDDDGMVWIDLDQWDNIAFIKIVAGEYDDDIDSLHNRVMQGWKHNDGSLDGQWRYGVALNEYSWDPAPPPGVPPTSLIVSIRFPRSDYKEVLRLVRRFNAKRKSGAA